MATGYQVDELVKWKWGSGWGQGKIKARFTQKVTRKIDGTEVTRKASADEPAYLIVQADEAEVLKSHSEVQSAS